MCVGIGESIGEGVIQRVESALYSFRFCSIEMGCDLRLGGRGDCLLSIDFVTVNVLSGFEFRQAGRPSLCGPVGVSVSCGVEQGTGDGGLMTTLAVAVAPARRREKGRA